jgi:flavin-dependent dehydrogenase
VIAADGATSVIARALTDEHREPLHRAVAIRCYATLRENHNHRCEFYFPKSVLPGYAWIFPIAERQANIGVGMRLDKYREIGASLETLLERFLEMLGNRVERATIEEVKSWQLPFGSKRYRRSFDGCLLAGDAGGFVDPLLGAGIYFGMKTGHLAAQVAEAALREGNTSQRRLSEFDRLWKRSLGWSLLRATLVQRIIIGQPWMLNTVCAVAALHPVLGRYVIKTLSGEKI